MGEWEQDLIISYVNGYLLCLDDLLKELNSVPDIAALRTVLESWVTETRSTRQLLIERAEQHESAYRRPNHRFLKIW